MRAAKDLQSNKSGAISLLQRLTPENRRAATAQMILEICDEAIDARNSACTLFDEFSYGSAAQRVLDWLGEERSAICAACKFLARRHQRDAAPRLRSLLDRPGHDAADNEIINCLTLWQDREALDLMIKKISYASDYNAGIIVTHLLRFGNEVIEPIKKIQQQSEPRKAKYIADALALFSADMKSSN